jgi:hypothetical protein
MPFMAGMVLPVMVAMPEWMYMNGPYKSAIQAAVHRGHIGTVIFLIALFIPLIASVTHAIFLRKKQNEV